MSAESPLVVQDNIKNVLELGFSSRRRVVAEKKKTRIVCRKATELTKSPSEALLYHFPDVRMAADSERNGVKMYLFVRKNKDDKESKEFYYLGRIHHEHGGLLEEFVMPNTDVSAVEIEYKLKTPVEKNLYDYLTSENVYLNFCNILIMKTINVVAAVIFKNGKVFATQRGYGEFKDGWEFPGGKVEEGECPEDALRREIREELEVEINVGELLDTIEYDYPTFHLSMKCYACTFAGGSPHLLEHEAAKWLTSTQLNSVDWLPADVTLIPKIAKKLNG